MRPAKFDDDHEQVARRDAQMINGPRPSPLRINQNSLVIHKPSSSNSYANHHHHHQQQQRNPVIIYTHSPKIIHTQARHFMALVQKLTGLTPSQHDSSTAAPPEHQKGGAKTFISSDRHDENESSSALTEENCGDHDGGGASDYDKERTSPVSSMFNAHKPYLADIPLFTPSWNDFFRSPRPLFKYNDKVSPSRNMGDSMSPSVNLELMKGLLPEY